MVHEITGDQMSKFAFLPETNRALIELWQHAVFVAQTDSSAGPFTLHSTGLEKDLIETLNELLHTMNLRFIYINSPARQTSYGRWADNGPWLLKQKDVNKEK